MTVFADSSAIVKRYADEAGNEQVRALDGPLVVGALARVEVAGALWRKHRMGELAAEDVAVLVGAFEDDWNAPADGGEAPFVAVAATSSVLELAARLVARHGLRAYDAVQLASASAARDALDEPITFAAFDHELRDAATREGFTLLP